MVNLELLSTRDVAHRLGVTPQQVARLVRAGGLEVAARGPGVRGPLLFDPEVVEKVVAERTAEVAR